MCTKTQRCASSDIVGLHPRRAAGNRHARPARRRKASPKLTKAGARGATIPPARSRHPSRRAPPTGAGAGAHRVPRWELGRRLPACVPRACAQHARVPRACVQRALRAQARMRVSGWGWMRAGTRAPRNPNACRTNVPDKFEKSLERSWQAERPVFGPSWPTWPQVKISLETGQKLDISAS